MIRYIVKKIILGNFFKIKLSHEQQEIAKRNVEFKYSKSIKRSLISGILLFPGAILIDMDILIGVLIPVTMVTGTAWFSISLANLKKKFENFGFELITNLFDSFFASLAILIVLALTSLNRSLFQGVVVWAEQYPWISIIVGIIGTLVVIELIKNLCIGALKFDMNDSMLSGQAELAERYFQRSLSVFHVSAEQLKTGKSLQIANYHIGVCFSELYKYLDNVEAIKKSELDENIKRVANELKNNPAMPQEEADQKSFHLIERFLSYCTNIVDPKIREIYHEIQNELLQIKKNKDEDQHMIDTRFAVIFEGIAEMLEVQGGTLFVK